MSTSETILSFSQNESDLLGLRVGRCVSSSFDSAQLSNQILEGAYDICRLTTAASDEDAVLKLEASGLPYYYSGSITRYKTRISDLANGDYIHPDIEYEKYDGTQNELLFRMLVGTWGTYPIGYYRTPFLQKLVTKEEEIKCVFEFYKKHNLQRDYPNNTIMFMRHNGNYVGFFALNIIDDRLESHIGGIVDPYREGGYFYDMQEYIRRFCLANRLNFFCFGARNENRRVNGIFQKYGYRAVDADNVFHIASLLTYTSQPEIQLQTTIAKEETQAAICSRLMDIVLENASSFLNYQSTQYNFKLSGASSLLPGTYRLAVSFPVLSDEEKLIVLKLHGENGKLISTGHFSLR